MKNNQKLVRGNSLKIKDYLKVFFKYSLFFSIIVLFIGYIFLKQEKVFMFSGDGFHQHYITLIRFKDLLINLFKNGSFDIFTWNINLGLDLFANFAYYIFGDFISYLSVFVPDSYIHIFYYIAAVVRLYLVGITFIMYAKYKKISDFYSIIGALMYTFCFYLLLSFIRHPYFTNAAIIFPLFMIGIEKIVIENKKSFFIFIVFLSFFSSFYFAYMMSLCIAIYGVILAISHYHKEGIKKIILVLLKTLVCALVGILMSSVVLIPTINQFLASGRSEVVESFTYSINYYRNILTSFISYSATNWTMLEVTSLALLAIPLSIKYFKENKNMFIWLLILFIPLLVGQIGSIFAGLSYPNERWSFIVPFILSFLSIKILNDHEEAVRSNIKLILFFGFSYLFLILLFDLSISTFMKFNIITFIGFLIIFFLKKVLVFKKINLFKILCFGILIGSLLGKMYFVYEGGLNYSSEFMSVNEPLVDVETNLSTFDNFESGIDYIKALDSDFYRISREPIGLYNISLLYDFNSINGYYSINPSELSELGYDLDSYRYWTNMMIQEFDYRTKILSLLSTKYFVSENKYYVPYGYELIDKIDDNYIYKNNYYIGFGSFYDSYIDEDTYEKFSAIEKENSLLESVVLDSSLVDDKYVYKNGDIYEELNNNITSIDYDISLDDNNFKLLDISNNKVNISIDSQLKGEYYLVINNLQFDPLSREDLIDLRYSNSLGKYDRSYFEEKYKNYQPSSNFTLKINSNDIVVSKRYIYDDAYNYDTGNVVLNLSYYNGLKDDVVLSFSALGNYSFDSIEIVVVNFDDYSDDVDKLNSSNFKVVDYGSGYMNATVDCEKDGVLQFSTIYSDGWEIYIDGEKVDTLKVNKYFLGTYIESGSHEVVLKYKTPYLNLGFILSLFAFGLFFVILILEKRKSEINEKR